MFNGTLNRANAQKSLENIFKNSHSFMQTFLPVADFEKAATFLDYKRLGKQRVECLQILNILLIGPYRKRQCGSVLKGFGKWESATEEEFKNEEKRPFGYFGFSKTPWYNHPAARMWRGHLFELSNYTLAICNEWIKRGYKDSIKEKILSMQAQLKPVVLPDWFSNSDFFVSHQSNLIRKLPEHYQKFWPQVPNNLPYVWPV